MRLEIYDNLNGSLECLWDAFPSAASYNLYLNGVVNQNVTGLIATISGLTVESYSNSAVSASTGNSLRPQNMPPVGAVTPSGTYQIYVTALVGGVEKTASKTRTVTVSPASIMLTTPMKRPFPYPNTGSPDG
jgi:hypothetical protein